MNVDVSPSVGRLVLWTVAQADDVTAPDTRTEHVFEPFTEGEMFVASFNVHVRNFKQVNRWQCGDLQDVNPYEV